MDEDLTKAIMLLAGMIRDSNRCREQVKWHDEQRDALARALAPEHISWSALSALVAPDMSRTWLAAMVNRRPVAEPRQQS